MAAGSGPSTDETDYYLNSFRISLISVWLFLSLKMVLRSDDILDQLDSCLSRMQAQLPSNPDTRRLPSGWVEHFDPMYVSSSSSRAVVLTSSVTPCPLQSKTLVCSVSQSQLHVVLSIIRYYIDLCVAQPRATYVHPADGPTNDGEESSNTPMSSSISTQGTSNGSSSRPPSRTDVKSRSGSRRATTAQQLYASSLESGSNLSKSVLPARESVSTSNIGSNSDPEHPHVVSTPAERSFAQNHPGRGDSNSRASPIGPSFPAYPSHDPRKFFDITRLAQGARKYRHDEASRSNGSSQTVLAHFPSTSQSPSPAHPANTSGEPSAGADGSTMNTLNPTNRPTSSTPVTSGPISSEAQALYNPSVVSKPLSPSHTAIVADRHKYSISVLLTGDASRPVSPEGNKKRPQPIQIIRPSDNYKLYTAVTEDETLKVLPNSSSTAYPNASGVTEDNLLVLPSHPTHSTTAQSPTINVLDVQNPDTPPSVLYELKPKSPIRTLSISRLQLKKKKKTASLDDSLVLQQPRPVHPLGDVPAHLSNQVSEDAQYYAEDFKGKGKERKSYGFSSIFETMDRLANRESGIIIKEYT